MSLSPRFNAFGQHKSWQDKVLEADGIWAQVKELLDEAGASLPQTPRRPDVRLIVANVGAADVRFFNPGDHSGSKEEVIPPTGDSTAAMIMIKGDTLKAQYDNAALLYAQYDLGTLGLSDAFVQDLRDGKLADIIAEAYGPAPLVSQAGKLADVAWEKENGETDSIAPVCGTAAAYGARPATTETVFLAQFQIFVKGSGTVPELAEGYGMNVAVSEDWKTKKVSTRPIVPSVAATYYGAHTAQIPVVTVHPDGVVKSVDLKNGTVISLDADLASVKVERASSAQPPSPPQP